MKAGGIPKATAQRLSLYLRQLEQFAAGEQETVSSRLLGTVLGLTDAQVRKDLAYFGQFGRPGVGYDVRELIAQIRRIMGTDRRWPSAIVGIGNVGRALVTYAGFRKRGFDIVALFDNDARKIGGRCAKLRIRGIDEFAAAVKSLHIKLCVISVPACAAQGVADKVTAAGVKGVLNFAPVTLSVPDGVALQAVDLAIELEQLAFKLSSGGT